MVNTAIWIGYGYYCYGVVYGYYCDGGGLWLVLRWVTASMHYVMALQLTLVD